MACSLKSGVSVSGFNETFSSSKTKTVAGFSTSFGPSQVRVPKSKNLPSLSIDFKGQILVVSDQKSSRHRNLRAPNRFSVQASIYVSKVMRWWEKTFKPNMVEIYSAQELVDALLNAGDRLVIVDFYSPGCGGCKTLHPKICQLAEFNPDAIFLKVNYEELRTMCHSLNIHVLPFFKFYRGAEGQLCSFSCTNATIKKFKNALAKHGTDRCSLGPAKGLNESDLLKLASAGEFSRNLPLQSTQEEKVENLVINGMGFSNISRSKAAGQKIGIEEQKALL